MATKYYCIKCDTQLNSQSGFSPELSEWTCTECGETLKREDVHSGAEREGDWRCEECGALLNSQYGFSNEYTRWMCTKCVHTNVKDEGIKGNKCPSCGSRLTKQRGYSEYSNEWKCADCGAVLCRDFSFEDYRVKEDDGESETREYSTPSYIERSTDFTMPRIDVATPTFSKVDTIDIPDIGDIEMPGYDETRLQNTEPLVEGLNTGSTFDSVSDTDHGENKPADSKISLYDLAIENAKSKEDATAKQTEPVTRRDYTYDEIKEILDRAKFAQKGMLDTSDGKCYFCPKCGDIVNEQYGFRLNQFLYDCRSCHASLRYFADIDAFKLCTEVGRNPNGTIERGYEQKSGYVPEANSLLDKVFNKKKELADLLICFFFGIFGVHKFKEGKPAAGLLYLFTWGVFGIGWLLDVVFAFSDFYND